MTDEAMKAMALTDQQEETLLSFLVEPRQMGIGLMQALPGLVEPVGLNHPLLGPHYRLTETGEHAAAAIRSGQQFRKDA